LSRSTTTSAPSARATSALRSPPTTPMTRAPAALPSWTAPLPTPPAAACTSSVSPAASRIRRVQRDPAGLVGDEEGRGFGVVQALRGGEGAVGVHDRELGEG